MRVMMLTPDTMIDRRILQEAATLADAWAEVLLVGMQSVDRRWPEHELRGEVKLQRFHFDGTDVRVLPWVPLRDAIARRLHALAVRAQGWAAHGGPTVVSRMARTRWTPTRIGSKLDRMGEGLCRSRVLTGTGFPSTVPPGRGVRPMLAHATGRVLRLLGRGTARFGRGVEACVGRVSAALHRSAVLMLRCFLAGFQVFLRLWSELSSRITGLSAYEYALYRSVRTYPYDVYHAHDLPMLKVAYRLARRWKAKLVYDAHELYPEIVTLSERQRHRLGRLERRYIRHADAVVTVNGFLAEEMANRYSIQPPHVILNAVPLPAEPLGERRWFHERLGLADDRVVVLYQGWLAPHRGLEALVRSGHHVAATVAIVLLGFGDYWADLEDLIAAERLQSRVFMVPAVSQEDLLRWTAAADVGVIPYQAVDLNTRYCSPNKLFEYIVAGVPIVANDLPFLSEVVAKHGVGVTEPLSTPESYGRAINRLATSTDLRLACRANARTAAKLLNWEIEGEKLLGLYRELKLT
jgi:glycosyltransferase involved in cell wall biosynthesis